MEQIERLINKTLKFFFIHNEGENNKKANNEHYYKRDIDKLLNYEPNDFLVKNINEEYELKSIPSEDYEESEETVRNSLNPLRKNIKTIIKEEVEEENSSAEEFNYSKGDEKEMSLLKKSDLYFSSSSNFSENSENTIEKEKNSEKTSEQHFYSSKSSPKTIETVRTNVKNELIDVSEKNDRDTLISSNTPYSPEEINNENFPFEDTIIIHKNESLSSDLVPKDYSQDPSLNCNKILLDRNYCSKQNTPNNLLDLLNNPNSSNNNNLNNQKIIIKISSFDSLQIEKLESFTLYGMSLKNISLIKKNYSIQLDSFPKEELKTKRSIGSVDNLIMNKNDNNKKNFDKSLFKPNQKKTLNKSIFSSNVEKSKNTDEHSKKGFSSKFFNFRNNKVNIKPTNTLKNVNNDNENKNESFTTKKTLQLISKNIQTNSIILNNPQEFYSEFFTSVIGKNDFNNKNNVSNRLQNISKMIESKRDSSDNYNETINFKNKNDTSCFFNSKSKSCSKDIT